MTDAECDAIALIVNAANACGLEHVAGVLRRNGYRIDELGHVVEKIGECTRCKLNTHVILNKRSGEFLCMLCRIDSLERPETASAPKPAHSEEVTQ